MGPVSAPRLVMSCGIYNSLLSIETIASEEGDKKSEPSSSGNCPQPLGYLLCCGKPCSLSTGIVQYGKHWRKVMLIVINDSTSSIS